MPDHDAASIREVLTPGAAARWAFTLALAVIAIGPLLPDRISYTLPDLGWYFAYPGLSALQAVLFYRASQRKALGPRLCRALQLSAAAFTLSVIVGVPDLLRAIGLGWLAPPAWVIPPLTVCTYLLGLAGIFRMPMQRLDRSGLRVFLADVAISVMGLGALVAVLITLPQIQGSTGETWKDILVYGIAQSLVLIGLNVLILRGVARPSSRAFWLFVGSLLCNLLAAAFRQLPGLEAWVDVAVFGKSALLVWAADAYLHDLVAPGEPSPTPQWMNSFNPLPIAATVGLLGLLVHATVKGDVAVLGGLALVVVVQVGLLITRLFLTARDNARLVAEQAERERQVAEAKMQAVGRLAGGIAHWFNNLLTTVIGHAELGVVAAGRDAAAEDFTQIRTAADRAAQLTRQLLAFSGQEYMWATDVDLAGFVTSLGRTLEGELPRNVSLVALTEAHVGEGRAHVRADRRLLESVFRELVSNAADAMPSGGSIVLRVGMASLDHPSLDAPLPIPAGEFVVVDVEDTGTGMTPEVRRAMFDPFFTTKPMHAAAGLGLAAVYGVVSAHGGGIDVETEPGRGTRMRIFLPLVTGAESLAANREAVASAARAV